MNYVIVSRADHPIQLQAFMDTNWRWVSSSRLNGQQSKFIGGVLLIDNLPEYVYKNAKQLRVLSYHWLILDTKYSPERLIEIAQKAGVILNFIFYPFQTKHWSREFLVEMKTVLDRQKALI